VFFIVLDLRLTKVGVQRNSFFMSVRLDMKKAISTGGGNSLFKQEGILSLFLFSISRYVIDDFGFIVEFRESFLQVFYGCLVGIVHNGYGFVL